MQEEQARSAKQKLKLFFAESFGYDAGHCLGDAVFAMAPGRVELAGNHTDHQGGKVISAAIERGIFGLAVRNGTNTIRISMKGFGGFELDLADSDISKPIRVERGTSQALVRGMLASSSAFSSAPVGFDMATCGNLLAGCGLSSSAAFEMLIGVCLESLCGHDACAVAPHDPLALALAGQRAERDYFGKPCGAQDQIASAFGGIVAMDFAKTPPSAEALAFDMEASGYALCLIDSRTDHSQYIDEFAAVPGEMRAVAKHFGKEELGSVETKDFLAQFQQVRDALGDRAAMRALHFFDETRRVEEQRQALERGDFEAFLAFARLTGASSAQYLQNVSPLVERSDDPQPVMVILSLCAHLLGSRGAWRVHGGGFGGGVLAFVPVEDVAAFVERMNTLLGYDACMLLHISAQGAYATQQRLD